MNKLLDLFTKIVRHLTGKRVPVFWENKNLASTNGNAIFINPDNRYSKKLELEADKLLHLKGLVFHELGHIIYSSFKVLNEACDEMKEGRFHKEVCLGDFCEEEERNLNVLLLILKQKRGLHFLSEVVQSIMNIIEDEWMENKLMMKYAGTKVAILYNKKLLFGNQKKVEELKKKLTPYQITETLMLYYVRTGRCDEYDLMTDRVKNILDRAIIEDDVLKRLAYVYQIMVNILPAIKEEIEKDNGESAKKNIQSNGFTSNNQQNTHQNCNGNPNGEGNQSGQDKSSQEQSSSNKSNSSEGQNSSKNNSSKEQSGSGDNSSKEQSGSSNESDASKKQDSFSDAGNTSGEQKGSLSKNDASEEQNNSSGEKGNSPAQEILSLLRKELDKVMDESFMPSDHLSSEELCVVQAVLKEKRFLETEKKKEEEVRKDIESSIGNLDVTISYAEESNYVDPSLKKTVNSCLRKIENVLSFLEEDEGEEPNCFIGPKINTSSLYRKDKRIFVKEDEKSEFDMAIAIMIDMSGSMRDGERIEAAIRSAASIYAFCNKRNIPICIYGHSVRSRMCCLVKVVEFKESGNKPVLKRLDSLSPGGCNDDLSAYKFLNERLLTRPESKRLAFMISDGRPSFNEMNARNDIPKLVMKYKKQGIIPIAAAIGDDRDLIKEMYKDNFLNISNLNDMPVKMANIIKKYV